MELAEIKCGKCGATLQVNAELPKCMCQYCGNEIALVNTANNAQAETMQTDAMAGQTVQDDPNEVTKYKNMLKMDIVVSIIAFILRFIFTKDIIIAFAAVIMLFLLPLRDVEKMLNKKDMMQRNGVQKGNIIGVAALVIIDIILWGSLLISQVMSIL